MDVGPETGVIALTATDLWPGPGWNYCFGLANLETRRGVYSMFRFGKPKQEGKEYQLCLYRMLKTAASSLSCFSTHPHTLGECTVARAIASEVLSCEYWIRYFAGMA